jgi:hypothetical protein
MVTDKCKVDGCQRISKSRKMCDMHYRRWRTHGDPSIVVTRMGVGSTFAERFWRKVDRTLGQGPRGECWEWLGCRTPKRYGLTNYKGKTERTHRVAFFLTNGETKKWVLHKCDNPPCCKPEHLYAGVRKDNLRDMDERNRRAKGQLIVTAKVDEHIVQLIRQKRSAGASRKEISEELGISRQIIGFIDRGQTWKHVK